MLEFLICVYYSTLLFGSHVYQFTFENGKMIGSASGRLIHLSFDLASILTAISVVDVPSVENQCPTFLGQSLIESPTFGAKIIRDARVTNHERNY